MSTPPATPYDSCVYFARCGVYVKIGYSSHPERRIKTLLTGRHIILPEDFDTTQPFEILALIPDCRMRDERIIHALFDRYRVAGEWFRFDLAFQRHLAGLRYQTDRARRRHAFIVKHEMKLARLHGKAA